MEEFIDLNLYESNNINENIITNPLHLFFQEVELAVKIAPNQIWGIKYAIDLNKYLFNQYITINQIKNELSSFIGNECNQAKNHEYIINVEVLNVDSKDLIYIEIIIYSNDGENTEFIQKFLLGAD